MMVRTVRRLQVVTYFEFYFHYYDYDYDDDDSLCNKDGGEDKIQVVR